MENLAEAATFGKTLVMVVDPSDTIWHPIESFSYEAAALLIAGDRIPPDAIELLSKTMAPNAAQLDDEDLYHKYLESVKCGLEYKGPYAPSFSPYKIEHCIAWHEYLLRKSNR